MFRRKYRKTYITSSVAIKKELGNGNTISYKLKFIDSFRFMSGSSSSLADNLSEGLHNKECRKSKSCLEYISTDDNKLICKCIDCNENHKLHFNKDLINRFANTYEILLFNKEDFYGSLSLEDIRFQDQIEDVDYRHAKNI